MSIHTIREKGEEYCKTKGSEHYHTEGVEPIDLIIELGLAEDFCLSSIIKYASRFKKTQNLNDLKKVADYAHILCGVKLQPQQMIYTEERSHSIYEGESK